MAKVRLWKLGSLEHKISPSDRAIQKLHDILLDIKEDTHTVDIIWDAALDVEVIEDGELEIISIPDPETNDYKYIKVTRK